MPKTSISKGPFKKFFSALFVKILCFVTILTSYSQLKDPSLNTLLCYTSIINKIYFIYPSMTKSLLPRKMFLLFFIFSCFVFLPSLCHGVVETPVPSVDCENPSIWGGSCGGVCGQGRKSVGVCTGNLTGGWCCVTSEQYDKLAEQGKVPKETPTSTGTDECQKNGGTCSQSCSGIGAAYGNCENGPPVVYCCQKNSTSTSTSTSASFTYTPLEEIPGQGITTDLSSYIKGLYSFAIFSVGIAALLMVIIGGFIYVTAAGNTSNVDKGKGYIRDALIGILIAFGSYLILYVINPDLVNIDLSNLNKLSLSGGVGSTGSTGSGTGGSGSATSNPGTCGGIKVQSGTAGCSLASGDLGGMLSCMVGKGINNYSGYVYSVTSNATGDNKEASAACCGNGHSAKCPHSNTSCHHGCTMSDKGSSYSVDYLTTSLSDTQICEVVDIAIACGATTSGNIWGPKTMCNGKVHYASGHGNHLHIPTSSCGH